MSSHHPRKPSKPPPPPPKSLADENGDDDDDDDDDDDMEIRAGSKIFSFPSPSPHTTPRPKQSSNFPAPSPLLASEPSPGIGVALGSPTQATAWSTPVVPSEASAKIAKPQQPDTPKFPEPQEQKPRHRKQKSGWSRLGGLFQRKGSKAVVEDSPGKTGSQAERPPTAVERMRTEQSTYTSTAPLAPVLAGSSTGQLQHTLIDSAHRGLSRFEARAEADRAHFMGSTESLTPRKLSTGNDLSRTRPSQDTLNIFGALGEKPAKPQLNLELPDIQMERYSVMFEKLLQPKETLQERRQSKLMRLDIKAIDSVHESWSSRHTPNDNLAVSPLKRRATSPRISRDAASGLSIQVTGPDTSTTSTSTRPPLQRPRTAPASSPSPAQANFSRPRIPQVPSLASTDSISHTEPSLPPTPTSVSSLTFTATATTTASPKKPTLKPKPLAPLSSHPPSPHPHSSTFPTASNLTPASPQTKPRTNTNTNANTRIKTPSRPPLPPKSPTYPNTSNPPNPRIATARQVPLAAYSSCRSNYQGDRETRRVGTMEPERVEARRGPLRPRVVEVRKAELPVGARKSSCGSLVVC
ncbi:hypothetical protein MBLNU230_g5372t1 [Neophaeotheca triangularis]